METITSSRDIDALFRRGRRTRRATFVVLCGETPAGRSQGGRVVFVAGRRLGNAVKRNRCKRVLREAVKRSGVSWPGQDVALIATDRTAGASPERLVGDLSEGLQDLGVWR